MASDSPNVQTNVPYNPLPHSDRAAEHYEMSDNLPQSPAFASHDFDRSQTNTPLALPPNIDDLPPGAAAPIPRFYGHALHDDGGRPRFSYADSFDTSRAPSVGGYDQSSLHALDPGHDISAYPGRYSSPLMSESPYRDNPEAEPAFYPPSAGGSPRILQEKQAYYSSPQKKKRKGAIIGSIIGGVLILAAGAVVAVYFLVIKKHGSGGTSSDTSSNNSPGNKPKPANNIVTWGGDGSTVTMENGNTFTYTNKFGGIWVQDPSNPFNNSARPQSWSPALNEPFNWGVDKIRGVNLGGWLTTEPFIAPALYEKYYNTSTPAIDEWTLSAAMRQNEAISDLEDHYKTFITEQDFAQIAAAGLNFVRIPLPFWAIEVRDGEPFLAKTPWTYFLKAIEWARKYGIRINLDLHAVPGSQNGWNHSGRYGDANFLFGVSGLFNAQRTLGYIQVIAEFISQPQYKDVVAMFGIINEPRATPYIGQENLARWYMEAYSVVRNASGYGEGKGPFISIHDGFENLDSWYPIFPGADRMAIDTHPYIAFGDQSTNPPSAFAATPCTAWGNKMNDSLNNFGLTAAGEFSLAINDCGLWVNGVHNGTRYEGTYPDPAPTAVGSCDQWNDWTTWDQDIKDGLMQFALSSMDALQNYFFWTWKIGNSTVTGKVEAPFWSYQLGLQEGWIPKDPRKATGACAALGKSAVQFSPPLQPSQTGGAGGGPISPSAAAVYAWPPTAINSATDASLLPYYTPTASAPTLAVPTFGSALATATYDAGNGWFNSQDQPVGYVEVSGCQYPDPWGGLHVPIPTAACGPGLQKRVPSLETLPTPPPVL